VSTETWGFWLHIDIGGRCEALLVSAERTPPSLFPAAQQQQRRQGNPHLSNLVCYVWLLQMVIWYVFLRNATICKGFHMKILPGKFC
jgi:hypothetical protein